MQRDIFKPTLLSLVIAQSLLTACSPSPSNNRDTSPATPVIASPTPVVAAPAMMMEAAAMTKMARYSPIMPMPIPQGNSEKYQHLAVNPIHQTATDAVATFSIDTDTGSYANVRRFLNNGQLPPTDAVRIEELINYFNYDFSQAKRLANAPFLVSTETAAAPWRATNRIIKVAIKADDPTITKQSVLPPANLVFLVDVSGSMSDNDKLPLVKSSLKMLTRQLRSQDTISIVTYAGHTQVTLPATKGSDTDKISAAIDSLDASGSTNGEAAIKLAYQQAKIHYKKDGINRILMMTDGDFNVGVSDVDEMLDIIRRERDSGVSLSTFGFGEGNLNDHMMEQVADNGNGNYSYIDSLSEAKKALVDEMSATFNTVAKDVKVQVEFNPQTVKEWRLIGYENRVLEKEDFNNDKVDAGELGAGKSVVALFEITPVGQQGWLDDSRYQAHPINHTGKNTELGFLKLRYKAPNSKTSTLLTLPISNQTQQPSNELAFALSVASFGETLKQSKYLANWRLNDSKRLAQANIGNDPQGIRREFIKLIDLADSLQPIKK
ncbi:VWA domain-containing protein [Moraxella sp. PS-22]|uniref:VWA domain-containing protein n=1 Tax=Moraxella tetraodonis TaxID=2767221 RepID=A0A9X1US86_9GAMM|nr:VWA domain-containing protein [Moraxella tetraodonis]MCG8148044.1 VWA domain-containing protein [Moraxella tetraodonis]